MVRRSSSGSSSSASHARPRLPNRSLAGGRPARLRTSTALISFLTRVRARINCERLEVSLRRQRVRSSPAHTVGSTPAWKSSASVRASKRSFLTFAWLIARTCMGFASATSATWASSTARDRERVTGRLHHNPIPRVEALGEQPELLRFRRYPASRACSLARQADRDLAEIAVNVQPDEPHNPPSWSIWRENRGVKRQLRIRARGPTGVGRRGGQLCQRARSPRSKHGLPALRSPTTPQHPSDAKLDTRPDGNAAAVFSSRYVKEKLL